MLLPLILQSLWLIAPAYVANGFPPVVRGKKPLDFGKNLGRNRLLGDGKTFEGTIFGIIAGVSAGFLQMSVQGQISPELGLAKMTLPLAFALSSGAIVGDIAGAFVKRRAGIKRGDPAILLDQLDFLVVALLFAGFLVNLPLGIAAALLIITPPVHLFTNFIAYKAKIKKTPW